MKKLTIFNLVTAGFLFMILLVSTWNVYQSQLEYGWKYEETITIGDHVVTRTIDTTQSVMAVVAIGGMLILSLVNALSSHRGLTLVLDKEEVTGITFPYGEPPKWYAEGDVINRTVEVGFLNHSIRIPLETIQKWFEKEEE